MSSRAYSSLSYFKDNFQRKESGTISASDNQLPPA